jgi:hypothetical protein
VRSARRECLGGTKAPRCLATTDTFDMLTPAEIVDRFVEARFVAARVVDFG